MCVCVCVRSISYVLHRQRTVTSQLLCSSSTLLSRDAFQTLPSMKRASGLSKIHGSAMNIRTCPVLNKGCLTIQSLGIITMYHGYPLCPSSLFLRKVVASRAYQLSFLVTRLVQIRISGNTVYCNDLVMSSVK